MEGPLIVTEGSSTPYGVDPLRALPMTAYRSDSHEVDLAAIWHDNWVFVATADEVAAPGDWVATTVGSQPVILLRRQDGKLAAMSNLCAHRGTLLAEGAGSGKRFQCPYHAWTYNDSGRLLSVPYAQKSDVDRDAHCLPTYRAEQWHGLIFVSLNTNVASLEVRFDHLDNALARSPIDNLHHWTSERGDEEWACNWKLAISNAMESYHLFKVHPETLEPYSPTASAYYLTGSADGTATGGSSRRGGQDDYLLLSLPPNFVAVVTGGMLLWQAVYPVAFDRVRVVTGGAYDSPSPTSGNSLQKLARTTMAKAADAISPDFLPEDKAICERGQRAATGNFDPGVLLPVEQVVIDFHHYLNRQLHDAAVPIPRSAPAVGVAKPAQD